MKDISLIYENKNHPKSKLIAHIEIESSIRSKKDRANQIQNFMHGIFLFVRSGNKNITLNIYTWMVHFDYSQSGKYG